MLRIALLLLVAASLLLSGCSDAVQDNPKVDTKEILSKIKEDDKTEISVEEAEEIAYETLVKIHEELKSIQEDKPEWAMDTDFLDNIKGYMDRYEYVEKRLANLVTEEAFAVEGGEWIYAYFCHCDSGLPLSDGEPMVRFQIEDIDADRLKISYITMDNDFMPGYGTRVLDFAQDNNQWKLADSSLISLEDTSYNLTFEDIQDYYSRIGTYDETGKRIDVVVDFIEEVKLGGEKYIVVKIDNDRYEVRNAKDSSFNYDLINEYNGY